MASLLLLLPPVWDVAFSRNYLLSMLSQAVRFVAAAGRWRNNGAVAQNDVAEPDEL